MPSPSEIAPERASWRPQVARPSRTPRTVVDPVIEPLWEGIHVLAHVADGAGRLIDIEGQDVGREFRDIAEALPAAVASSDAVMDGWLTQQATRSGMGLALVPAEAPRGIGLFRPLRPADPKIPPHDRPGEIALVAVDLLVLDGQLLLELPLLERKRLLDSVLLGSDLVRASPFVRPPLMRWMPSWKAVGFKGAVLKAANGRYVPGALADDWSIVEPIARR